MARIIAASHAFPPHTAEQTTVKEAVRRMFSDRVADLEHMLPVFDNSRIDSRQFMMPLEWYRERRTPSECNQIYQKHGLELALNAAKKCIAAAGCAPGDIDHVIFVSSTGYATPTLDAILINRLELSATTSRVPIWGLGCAAGAAGLSRAFEHCLAYPSHRVLLCALECCSLTFMSGDLTKKNLVATALFSDGAAAVLIAGDQTPDDGVRIIASRSHLFPDSYELMGWDFREGGMQLVLSPKLPVVVKRELCALVTDFLAAQGLTPKDLRHYLTHPGGARVIDAYQEVLRLTAEDLRLTEDVLRRHGNISSVSVLVVLEKWLAERQGAFNGRTSGYGLLSAFGPGFSAELLLVHA